MAFSDGLSWLELFGALLLSYNSGMAIYQSWGDVAAISLVAFAYFNIVSLFVCLKLEHGAQANPSRRDGFRACVWILTMSLTFGFVYQIMRTTTPSTPQVALLLWAMPAATGIAVFILFRQDGRSQTPVHEELLDVNEELLNVNEELLDVVQIKL